MTVAALSLNTMWPIEQPQPAYGGYDDGVLGPSLYSVVRRIQNSLMIRERAGTAVGDWRWDGFNAHAILTQEQDLNGRFVDALLADATAGLTAESDTAATSVSTTPAERRVAQLMGIQASFGLPMRTLAEVLCVSRPQIYKWFDATAPIQLRGESAARLNAIERLARLWSSRTASPLAPWLQEQVSDGRSLSDLLTSDDLSLADVEHGFDTVVLRIAQAPKTRSQQMRDSGFTRRPSYRALPSDE